MTRYTTIGIVKSVTDLFLLFLDALNLHVFVVQLLHQDSDSCLELPNLILIELILSLLSYFSEFVSPLFNHLGDMGFELSLTLLSILDILTRNGGIQCLSIRLSLQDQVSLLGHELMESFELLDLQDQH